MRRTTIVSVLLVMLVSSFAVAQGTHNVSPRDMYRLRSMLLFGKAAVEFEYGKMVMAEGHGSRLNLTGTAIAKNAEFEKAFLEDMAKICPVKLVDDRAQADIVFRVTVSGLLTPKVNFVVSNGIQRAASETLSASILYSYTLHEVNGGKLLHSKKDASSGKGLRYSVNLQVDSAARSKERDRVKSGLEKDLLMTKTAEGVVSTDDLFRDLSAYMSESLLGTVDSIETEKKKRLNVSYTFARPMMGNIQFYVVERIEGDNADTPWIKEEYYLKPIAMCKIKKRLGGDKFIMTAKKMREGTQLNDLVGKPILIRFDGFMLVNDFLAAIKLK